jgi:hypothetical protein
MAKISSERKESKSTNLWNSDFLETFQCSTGAMGDQRWGSHKAGGDLRDRNFKYTRPWPNQSYRLLRSIASGDIFLSREPFSAN